MKSLFRILSIYLFSLFFTQLTFGQTPSKEHSFKIAGKTRLPDTADPSVECLVEYDPSSSDHLIITAFGTDGNIISKVPCRFTGKTFNLGEKDKYFSNKKLIADGPAQLFSANNVLDADIIYKDGSITAASTYYKNGNKHMLQTGDATTLNGPYKIWFNNGNLYLEGNYTSNKKDGLFHLFDESGAILREGLYEKGKLISGEAVVADILYKSPDQTAWYTNGQTALEEELIKRSSDLEEIKELGSDFVEYYMLQLTIDKQGFASDVNTINSTRNAQHEILQAVFNQLPGFTPGLVEGIPVTSSLNLEVRLSNSGLKLISGGDDTETGETYSIVEEMPEFPGGDLALRQFIAINIKYPVLAQENGIQGTVYASFVIDKEGYPEAFRVVKSVHPVLDDESIRVLKEMPKWTPGKQKGQPVRVRYTVPVSFVIKQNID